MKEVQLTRGYIALVDDEDFELVNRYKWRAFVHKRTVYAKGSRTGLMHRVILGLSDPKITVDHIDHNGLNNQKANLRVCSQRQNVWNARKYLVREKRNHTQHIISDKYKGVVLYLPPGWPLTPSVWKAKLKLDGEERVIGYFDTEEAAALAYNTAAKELYGEFACLNEIA